MKGSKQKLGWTTGEAGLQAVRAWQRLGQPGGCSGVRTTCRSCPTWHRRALLVCAPGREGPRAQQFPAAGADPQELGRPPGTGHWLLSTSLLAARWQVHLEGAPGRAAPCLCQLPTPSTVPGTQQMLGT